MPASRKRLLIINNQLKFSGVLKRALESTGNYHVTAFTSPESAVKFARSESIDIAMVDFRMEMAPPVAVIKALRKLHPRIALIVSPANNETLDAIKDLDIQTVIEIPISARELLPLLEHALQDVQQDDVQQSRPEPAPQPKPKQKSEPPPAPKSTLQQLDNMHPDGTSTLDVDMSDMEAIDAERSADKPIVQNDSPPPKPTSIPVVNHEDQRTAEEKSLEDHDMSLFKRLEADEPSLLTLEEGGTVNDLRANVVDTGMRRVIEILGSQTGLVDPVPLPVDDGDTEIPNLARAILRDSVEQASPLDLLQVAGEAAVEMDDDEAEELEADLGKSSPIKPPEPIVPPPPRPTTMPGGAPIKPTMSLSSKPETLPSSKPTPPATTPATKEALSTEQLAVLLTQASLELTAEATILARDGEIVAMAGKMHESDAQEIGRLIDNDWSSNRDQARIRFVNLVNTGTDYMLFTQRTQIDDSLSLTMVFAGNMPLKVIRRQSKRLLEALNDVPDVPPVERIEDEEAGQVSELVTMAEQAYAGEKMAHSYVWLLHQDIESIDINTAQVLASELNAYLQRKLWEVYTLDIEEDYIYLYAEIPGEPVAHELIRKLKDRSGKIIRRLHPELTGKQIWADAYLTLVPGREMSIEEIQRFIRFGRM